MDCATASMEEERGNWKDNADLWITLFISSDCLESQGMIAEYCVAPGTEAPVKTVKNQLVIRTKNGTY